MCNTTASANHSLELLQRLFQLAWVVCKMWKKATLDNREQEMELPRCVGRSQYIDLKCRFELNMPWRSKTRTFLDRQAVRCKITEREVRPYLLRLLRGVYCFLYLLFQRLYPWRPHAHIGHIPVCTVRIEGYASGVDELKSPYGYVARLESKRTPE